MELQKFSIRRGDSAYVIVEGPTWEEAEANAVALGGHLLTINDTAEYDWIIDTYKGYSNDDAQTSWGRSKVYIGYNDKDREGQWEWISGESSSWEPVWTPNMPDNGGGKEDVAELYLRDTQHWRLFDQGWINDVGNEQITGIAEIPLAPNNAPTGTPKLTGNFQVGQTISIDASSIADADNHEYWTPSYKYSWEVSEDNGTTWIALTSDDATDGDESYKITSEEIGMQLRGLVSYLDGYGTNERINSKVSNLISNTFELEWLIKSGLPGYFRKITTGEGGALIAAGHTFGDDGEYNPLATKISSHGEVIWLNQLTNNGEQSYSGVQQDANGNILLSASSRGANFLEHAATGGLDAYIVKLSPHGEVIDSTQVASSTNDWSTDIYIDNNGVINLTGNTGWGSDLGGNQAIGYHEGFWSKFDSSLTRKSLDFIGTSNNEGIRGITEIDGAFAFVGEEQLQYDGNTIGVVYISNGTEINKIAEIGAKSPVAKTRLTELTSSRDGHIYTVGYSDSPIKSISPNGIDALVAKYSPSGELVWSKFFGTNGKDVSLGY